MGSSIVTRAGICWLPDLHHIALLGLISLTDHPPLTSPINHINHLCSVLLPHSPIPCLNLPRQAQTHLDQCMSSTTGPGHWPSQSQIAMNMLFGTFTTFGKKDLCQFRTALGWCCKPTKAKHIAIKTTTAAAQRKAGI